MAFVLILVCFQLFASIQNLYHLSKPGASLKTPQRNCLYCTFYNKKHNSCEHPRADTIATFKPDFSKDCPLFKFEKTEQPVEKPAAFVAEYCLGKKCGYYRQSVNICTRPSLCPWKDKG